MIYAKKLLQLFVILLITVSIPRAFAADHNVTNNAELNAAFAGAQSGDVIKIAGGTYTPGDSLLLPAGVAIEGGWDVGFSARNTTSNETIIDGAGAHSLFSAHGTTGWKLDGLTLKGAIAPYVPEVLDYNSETNELTVKSISGSVLRVTGGGSGELNNVRVIENDISRYERVHVVGESTATASNVGAAIYVHGNASTLVINNSYFSGNFDSEKEYYSSEGNVSEKRSDAIVFVGGIEADEPLLKINETIFIGHTDTIAGSVIGSYFGEMEVLGSEFENNRVYGHIIRGDGIVAQLTNSKIMGNYSTGEMIRLRGEFIKVLENVTIVDNLSANTIVDIQDGEISLIDSCIVENNQAMDGRIFNVRADVNQILNTTVRNNRSEPVGQRIFDTRGSYFEISGCLIENNHDVRHNIVSYQCEQLVFRDNIVRGNYTGNERIINVHSSAVVSTEIINNVFSENSSQRTTIHLDANGPQVVANNTFYKNEVRGGPILETGRVAPLFWIINNIFSGNIADEARMPLILTNIEQPFLTVSHNLVADWVDHVSSWDINNFFLPNENNNFEGDPKFVDPPANLALQEGSDAIGAGTDPMDWPEWIELETDINGSQRTAGAFDIGAYQGIFGVSVKDIYSSEQTFQLSQNYPNPFTQSTTIEFVLDNPSHVTIEVYNLYGQHISTLTDGYHLTGKHAVQWAGSSDTGHAVPSGTYFYRMVANGETQVNKMIMF